MQAKKLTQDSMLYPVGMQTGRPSKYPRTPFCERVHAAREAMGLSQAQVAEKMGVTQTAYAVWERHPVALRPEQIEKLAAVLSVTVEHLFGREETNQRGKGPVGKARRLFESVSKLPRSRQQRILATVEDMLTAQRVAVNA
jgi:transcriptional regulator with XRE-family HTH domain